MGARPAAAITAAALAAGALWVAGGASKPPQRAPEEPEPRTGAIGLDGRGGGSGRPEPGRAGPGRAAVRGGSRPTLLLAGHGAIWEVDVRADRARRLSVPGLSGGDPPYRIVRRGRRFVVWSGGTYVTGRRLDADDPLDPLARRAWFFLPSAHEGRVWLTFIDRDSPATDIGFRAVREVTAGGRVTVPDARPPRGWPERAARSGLLLRSRSGPFVLWDPRTDSVVNRLTPAVLGDLGPVAEDTLASCVRRCGVLRLTDLRTGEQRRIAAPRRHAFEPPYGAFSPDGRQLALPVRVAGRPGRRLALVDVGRGRTRVIPGSRVPRGYTFVDWSRDGRHVFLTGGQWVHDRRIVVYRRGAPRATRVDVATGAFHGTAAR
jgi:hypothetical protein